MNNKNALYIKIHSLITIGFFILFIILASILIYYALKERNSYFMAASILILFYAGFDLNGLYYTKYKTNSEELEKIIIDPKDYENLKKSVKLNLKLESINYTFVQTFFFSVLSGCSILLMMSQLISFSQFMLTIGTWMTIYMGWIIRKIIIEKETLISHLILIEILKQKENK